MCVSLVYGDLDNKGIQLKTDTQYEIYKILTNQVGVDNGSLQMLDIKGSVIDTAHIIGNDANYSEDELVRLLSLIEQEKSWYDDLNVTLDKAYINVSNNDNSNDILGSLDGLGINNVIVEIDSNYSTTTTLSFDLVGKGVAGLKILNNSTTVQSITGDTSYISLSNLNSLDITSVTPLSVS